MANRVAIGRRASGQTDRGLNISGLSSGSLTNFDNVTTPAAIHNLDSSDVIGGSLSVYKFGQGTITKPTDDEGRLATIQHQWASNVLQDSDSTKNPLFAVRWNLAADLTNGVATRVYTPNYYDAVHEEETDNCEDEEDGEENCETVTFVLQEGVRVAIRPNALDIFNFSMGVLNEEEGGLTGGHTIYYAYAIFHQEDFTNGAGL